MNKSESEPVRRIEVETSDGKTGTVNIQAEGKGRWMDTMHKKWAFTAVLVFAIVIAIFFIFSRFSSVVAAVSAVWKILEPFIIGFVVAYLLLPLFNLLERKLTPFCEKRTKKPGKGRKISKALSTIITLVAAFVVIAALIWLVLPQVLESLVNIVATLPDKLNNLSILVEGFFEDYPYAQEIINNILGNTSDSLIDWLKNDVLPELGSVVSDITTGVMGVVSVLLNIVIGVIICVYVLNSKEVFTAQTKKVLYSNMTIEHSNAVIEVARMFHKIFGGFITGKILDSLIIGILCFIAMTILNIPYAVMISVIVGVTNIIPFFGPFIGAIPSAIIIFMESPVKTIWFVIMILVLQQLDGNVIGPLILGDSTGLPSFWVMFAILIGGGFFGFAGMILGVPVFAVIYALISAVIAIRLSNKELPVETELYKTIDHLENETGEPVYFDFDEYGLRVTENKKVKQNADSANEVMSSFIKRAKKGNKETDEAAESGLSETEASEEKNDAEEK